MRLPKRHHLRRNPGRGCIAPGQRRGTWAMVLGAMAALTGASCTGPAGGIDVLRAVRAASGPTTSVSPMRADPPRIARFVPASPDTTAPLPRAELGELTLRCARNIALRQNPDIAAITARLEAAAAQVATAESSFYPVVSFGHNSTRTFQTPAVRNRFNDISSVAATPPLTGDPVNPISFLNGLLTSPLLGQTPSIRGDANSFSEHSTTISVRWTLFDGLVRDARLLAARMTHQAADAARRDVRRLIIQAVDAAYFRAQLGREELRIARADEQFSHEQLTEAHKRLTAGKATRADVLNFEVRLRAAQTNVTAATGARDSARVLLAELMGLAEAKLADELVLSELADETPAALAAPDEGVWIERAMQDRPDLRQRQFEVTAGEHNVQAAKRRYAPEVTLTSSYGFDSVSDLGYERGDQASAAGIEVAWQIFTGGARRAAVRLADAELAQARAARRGAELKVASDVRLAVVALIDAQEQVRLQRLNLVSARENRRIIRLAYAAGKVSLVRLNEAQRDLIETDARLSRARIRLRQAWSDLYASAATYPEETTSLVESVEQPPAATSPEPDQAPGPADRH